PALHRSLPAHAPTGGGRDARTGRPPPERGGPRGMGQDPRGAPDPYVRAVSGIAAPVMPDASRLVKNKMSAAASSGWTHVFGSAFGMLARFTGWSIVVGRIALAVIPWSFVSAARASVQRTTAPFAIA